MTDFQSDFVFGLQGKRYQDFITGVAKPEIEKVLGTSDYEIIGFEGHLSFKDFENTKNSIASHIYTNFLKDIIKDEETGKVSFTKKVCVTLDERLCNESCPNTGRKIAKIKLAEVDLACFIYFDIKEFFDFVYGSPSQILNKEFLTTESINLISQNEKVQNHQSKKQIDLIKRSAFIHNFNYDNYNRKYAYVWTEINEGEGRGRKLFHEYYDNLRDMQEGDFLDLYFEEGVYYPRYIELSENQKEITNFVKRFEGKLTFPSNVNHYAFINTDEGERIYVKRNLAESLFDYDGEIVECVAYSDSENGWQAEKIFV